MIINGQNYEIQFKGLNAYDVSDSYIEVLVDRQPNPSINIIYQETYWPKIIKGKLRWLNGNYYLPLKVRQYINRLFQLKAFI